MRLNVILPLLFAAVSVEAGVLTGKTLRVYDAADADQGVAVDAAHFYAVDNHVIAKHSRESGELVARWDGGKGGLIAHLNSCIVTATVLECANSNYPATPMASSIEYFDPISMTHVRSHSFGLTDEGSLTWTDTVDGGRNVWVIDRHHGKVRRIELPRVTGAAAGDRFLR